MLATLLAGHTAEKLIFDEMTTGGYDDIERATVIARKMVTDYGMSDKLGPRTFGRKDEPIFLGREIAEQRNYSEKIAEEIDDEVHQIIEHAYEVARKILAKNKPRLMKVAEELITKETLEGEELEALLNDTVSTPVRKTKAEATPIPEKATAKARSGIKKAPVIPPGILPKTAPATLD